MKAGAEKVSLEQIVFADDHNDAFGIEVVSPSPAYFFLQVIVTSYLFPSAKFSLDRLRALEKQIGKDKLVVDVR